MWIELLLMLTAPVGLRPPITLLNFAFPVAVLLAVLIQLLVLLVLVVLLAPPPLCDGFRPECALFCISKFGLLFLNVEDDDRANPWWVVTVV